MRLADRLRSFLASGLLTMEKHEPFAEKRDRLVTPAEAGVQKSLNILDSRLRGNDNKDSKKPYLKRSFCDRRELGFLLRNEEP